MGILGGMPRERGFVSWLGIWKEHSLRLTLTFANLGSDTVKCSQWHRMVAWQKEG